MRKKSIVVTSVMLASLMMLSAVGGCGKKDESAADNGTAIFEPIGAGESEGGSESGSGSESGAGSENGAVESTGAQETQATSGRADGERFEGTIILEGMEETVKYEHVINKALGFEIDYDYESFERVSDSDRERFISIYDDKSNPENYLEITRSTESAEAVADAIGAELSKEFDISRETLELDNAGNCICIDASCAKNNGGTPDNMQAVYIIPANGGSIVATAHYFFEAAEGFGRVFGYMVNTMYVIDGDGSSAGQAGNAAGKITDDMALSAVKNYCYRSNPDLEGIEEAGEYPVYWEIESTNDSQTVVLFRSYTGAEVRYYVDKATGETYVTEFVQGITDKEEKTGETFNVMDQVQ